MNSSAAVRQGIRLEIVTIVYMTFEALFSLGAAVLAHSALLAAFGVDSLIELLSGGILLWRLRAEAAGGDLEEVGRAEHRAAWGTVLVLGLLCIYILVTSIFGLVTRAEAETSPLGIGVSLAAVVFMPYLAHRKSHLARDLHSLALADDATASITCAYMAGAVLIGLVLNGLVHWWWAEDVAALVFLFWLARETWEAYQEARGSE
ncbi:MAG TPA: cation transporter [Anaerolineaceae bacterium]|jgi:divalent metal cation (Fe/Co/Zn/Cd) transporter